MYWTPTHSGKPLKLRVAIGTRNTSIAAPKVWNDERLSTTISLPFYFLPISCFGHPNQMTRTKALGRRWRAHGRE
jgi:hypothetical protein